MPIAIQFLKNVKFKQRNGKFNIYALKNDSVRKSQINIEIQNRFHKLSDLEFLFHLKID